MLSRLDLDPGRCHALVAADLSNGIYRDGRSWHDADSLSSRAAVAELVQALSRAAEEHHVQLVVKPHPLDADIYAAFDITVLPHTRLAQAGVTLYQLLGAADAIISDVSSVWVDF